MKSSNRITGLVSDLAGYWTEPVLEILNAAGSGQGSVENEIDVWHTLNAALQSRLQAHGSLGPASSLGTVKEQVFASAISELARKYGIREEQIPSRMPPPQLTAVEYRLFGELKREPGTSGAFKSGRQTDFMPRLQFAAAAG